jgi:hypothetical protein
MKSAHAWHTCQSHTIQRTSKALARVPPLHHRDKVVSWLSKPKVQFNGCPARDMSFTKQFGGHIDNKTVDN